MTDTTLAQRLRDDAAAIDDLADDGNFPAHFLEQARNYRDSADIAADRIEADAATITRLTADNKALTEWQQNIIGLCKALGSDELAWGGDKSGWGFIHFFVKHLHTRATAAEAKLAKVEAENERITFNRDMWASRSADYLADRDRLSAELAEAREHLNTAIYRLCICAANQRLTEGERNLVKEWAADPAARSFLASKEASHADDL